jgi:hypothetical protein
VENGTKQDDIKMTGLNLLQKFQRFFPLGYRLFMKIAEPRTVRIGFFGIYICILVAGIAVLTHPPRSFQHVDILWTTLNMAIAVFLILGSVLSAVAVLPGIWWLERTGLWGMFAGMALFALFTSGAFSSIGIAFILVFALRWREIRRFQLAPLKLEPRKG